MDLVILADDDVSCIDERVIKTFSVKGLIFQAGFCWMRVVFDHEAIDESSSMMIGALTDSSLGA
jgi:hypothetical protein